MARRPIAVLCLCGVFGCGSETPTEPSTTEPAAVTETFSNVVQRRGATSRTISTSAAGTLTVSLTSLGQEGAAVSLGLGVRDEAAGQCSLGYTVVTNPYSGRQLSASADAGVYCVTVSDIGELTGATSFSVTIVHY